MNAFTKLYDVIIDSIDTLKKGEELLATEKDMFVREILKTKQCDLLDELETSISTLVGALATMAIEKE